MKNHSSVMEVQVERFCVKYIINSKQVIQTAVRNIIEPNIDSKELDLQKKYTIGIRPIVDSAIAGDPENCKKVGKVLFDSIVALKEDREFSTKIFEKILELPSNDIKQVLTYYNVFADAVNEISQQLTFAELSN